MLLRFASLLILIFIGVANFAWAETRVDVGAMGTSQNLAPYLQLLTTENPSVLVELPRDATGKVGVIALKSSRTAPSYLWAVMTLVNTTTTQRNLVVAIDHQKFPGSRLIYPLAPGSVVASVAHTGAVAPARITALGQDAFGIMLEPSTTVSLALELTSESPAATLWERDAFDSSSRSIAFNRSRVCSEAAFGSSVA